MAARMRKWTLWYIAGALALTIVVMALTSVLSDVFAVTQARMLPAVFVSTFNEITDFGKSGWVLWPCGIILLVVAAASAIVPRRAGLLLSTLSLRLMFLFTAIALPGLFTNLVKGLIGRARPFVTGIADPYVFNSFVWRPEYASLPSGHATTALSVAVALGALWPRARIWFWGYAALICISRVVITAHYPSDVIAGGVVGGVGALLVRNYFAARGLGFGIATDGTVNPLPGPSWRRIKRVAAR
jgi:undecaprenyl-diphosphatase